MGGRFYEVVFRLPFLLILEILLTLDIRDFDEWTSHARLIQVSGKNLKDFFAWPAPMKWMVYYHHSFISRHRSNA